MLFEAGGADEEARNAWEVALEEDSRYVDVEWVRDIRRWPPSLVSVLEKFKASSLYSSITE